MSTFDLARLIHPISVEEFYRDYWEQKPLVINRNASDYYSELLTLDDIDRVITTFNLKYPDVELTNAITPVSSGDYTTNGGRIDVVKLYQLFADGATIIVPALHEYLPALTRLCRSMEDEISVPFQTNIYLTPGQELGGPETTQGFRVHYDTHDVFAIQVAGRKTWKIYHEPVRLPHRAQNYKREEHGCPDATQVFELQAGDVVYIPRGWVHSAEASGDLSLHITLGVMAYRWSELLIEAISDLSMRDEDFRRCLPVGFARPGFDRSEFREKAKELLHRIVDAADVDGAFDHFVDRLVNSRGAVLRGQMGQLAGLQKLVAESWVGARSAVIHRFEESEDKIVVRAYGKQTTMPIYAAEPLRYALENARYRVSDLPGSLDDAGKLTLIRRLIREGLVKLLDEPAA